MTSKASLVDWPLVCAAATAAAPSEATAETAEVVLFGKCLVAPPPLPPSVGWSLNLGLAIHRWNRVISRVSDIRRHRDTNPNARLLRC